MVAGNDGKGGERLRAGRRAMPVALNTRVCGESGALSERTRLVLRWPEAVGVKTREMVQLEPGASEAVQLLVKLKSEALGPERVTEEMVKGAFPELMTVSTCGALEVPWVVEGNESEEGERVTAGAAATPVPLRARVCGLPAALSTTARSAVDVPVVVGEKLILTEQLALGARLAGQVLV